MSEVSIHRLLDRHVEVLTAMGSAIADRFLAEPATDHEARETLRAAGFNDRDDVVALFTWRGYATLDQQIRAKGLHLFWETPYMVTCAEAIELRTDAAEIRLNVCEDLGLEPIGDDFEASWPGPDYMLPFAFFYANQWLAVDCRPDPVGGTVALADPEDELRPLFDSLADAIATATYCLETKLWCLDEIGRIKKTRNTEYT